MTVGNNLIDRIKKEFVLDWNGIHGYQHWMRVKENGLVLSGKTGANPRVVKLFAVLHDSKRMNDGRDPNHGKRAADFIKSLKDDLIFLTKEELDLLVFACEKHSYGLTDADVTVQTCWDADRLDLGRVGTKPNPQFLCTPAAKDQALIEWAYRRSLIY